MKQVHLLAVMAVDDPAATYAPLVAAARELGLRIGWLDLAGSLAIDPTAGPSGAFRRVAVTADGLVVSAKTLAGPPVLRDLVREHFQGCTAVLVAGATSEALAQLTPDGDGWRLDDRRWADSASFARALRGSLLNASE